MPEARKKPLTWGRVLDGATRLDKRHDTEIYGRAVVLRMLGRVVELQPPPPQPRAVFFVKSRPPVLSPAQRHAAWRRKKAYEF